MLILYALFVVTVIVLVLVLVRVLFIVRVLFLAHFVLAVAIGSLSGHVPCVFECSGSKA